MIMSLIMNFLLQSVVEKVVYKVSDENPEWTVAKRSAWIESSIFGFSTAIQAFGLDRFKKNCVKMSNGFNYVLAHMFPQTAQFMNPNLSQMGFSDKVRKFYYLSMKQQIEHVCILKMLIFTFTYNIDNKDILFNVNRADQ